MSIRIFVETEISEEEYDALKHTPNRQLVRLNVPGWTL